MPVESELLRLNVRITRCKLCPRLSQYIRQVGKTKVKRFAAERLLGNSVACSKSPLPWQYHRKHEFA